MFAFYTANRRDRASKALYSGSQLSSLVIMQ